MGTCDMHMAGWVSYAADLAATGPVEVVRWGTRGHDLSRKPEGEEKRFLGPITHKG